MNEKHNRYSFDENLTPDEQAAQLTQGVGDESALTRQYWYVIGINSKGRRAIIGPKSSEAEADRFGLEKLGEGFEVKPFSTRSLAKATSMWKAQQLGITANLDKATESVRHGGKGSGVRA